MVVEGADDSVTPYSFCCTRARVRRERTRIFKMCSRINVDESRQLRVVGLWRCSVFAGGKTICRGKLFLIFAGGGDGDLLLRWVDDRIFINSHLCREGPIFFIVKIRISKTTSFACISIGRLNHSFARSRSLKAGATLVLRKRATKILSRSLSAQLLLLLLSFATLNCGVSALVLKGLTHIRVWSLLDSEGASVGPFLLMKHIRSP